MKIMGVLTIDLPAKNPNVADYPYALKLVFDGKIPDYTAGALRVGARRPATSTLSLTSAATALRWWGRLAAGESREILGDALLLCNIEHEVAVFAIR